MASKYTGLADGHRIIIVRKWDDEYYWIPFGTAWEPMRMPKERIIANVKKYKGEWFDTEKEALEHAQYNQDLLNVELLMDAESEEDIKKLDLLAQRVEAYEEIHYPIAEPGDDQ